MKRFLVLAAVLTAIAAAQLQHSRPAAALTMTSGPGGQLYSSGEVVTVRIDAASAGYTSELWLYSPGTPQKIGTNREWGKTVQLGTFPAGTELVFGIYVQNTGHTFKMGPGSRNPDGLIHAKVTSSGGGVASVGFEDLYGGGDQDFNDAMMFTVYNWTGFYRPIDNPPTLNSVKAGQSVPVKFGLGGDVGLDIFAAGSPSSSVIACPSGASTDEVETVTAGGSSLSYDAATGQYTYVWKTEKAWAGSCRRLTLKLRDGSEHSALFELK
jgi:hypothetical protein